MAYIMSMELQLLLVASVILVSSTAGIAPYFKTKIKPLYNVNVSDDIELTCRVRGDPRPEITWYKDGDVIAFPNERITYSRFNLRIKEVQLSDAGNYSCKAVNKYGTITGKSNVRVFKTEASAPWLEVIGNRTAEVGENVTFTCRHIPPTESNLMLHWLRHYKQNSSYVNEQGESYVEISKNQTINVLRLYNVTQEDEGRYTCLAANRIGYNYATVFLEVHEKTNTTELHNMQSLLSTASPTKQHLSTRSVADFRLLGGLQVEYLNKQMALTEAQTQFYKRLTKLVDDFASKQKTQEQ